MTYDVRGRPVDVLERAIRELPYTHDIDLSSRLISPGLWLAVAGHPELAVEVWRRAVSPEMPRLNHAYGLDPLVGACGGAGVRKGPDGRDITEAELDRIDMDARLRLTLQGSSEMQRFAAIWPEPDFRLIMEALRLARPPSPNESQALTELEKWLNLPDHPRSGSMDEQARLVAADIAARLGDDAKARDILLPWLGRGLDGSSAIDLGIFLSLRSLSRLAASGIVKEDIQMPEGDCRRLATQLVAAADRRLQAGRETGSRFADWRALLNEIGARAIAETEQLAIQEFITDEQRRTGWLGKPGASARQIADAETRLGTRLPPFYREFLETSNGFGSIETSVWRLRPAEEIAWFRDAEPDSLATWMESDKVLNDYVDDETYRRYGSFQAPMRPRYLKTALEISDYQEGVVLLIPDVMTQAGEWEAWLMVGEMTWRFPSFRELMEEGTLARD